MFPKTIIIYLLFSSLFSQCLTQSLLPTQLNNKKLMDFVRCVTEKIDKSELNELTSQTVLSLMITNKQTDYKKMQETFTKYYDKISDCFKGGYIPKLGDGTSLINLDVLLKSKYNWSDFMQCLTSKVDNIEESPFKKIVDYINKEKYLDAVKEEFKLRNNGNTILKECMPIKISSLNNQDK